MTAAALVAYWFGVPAFIIGIPAMCVPVFVWCSMARTPKRRRR